MRFFMLFLFIAGVLIYLILVNNNYTAPKPYNTLNYGFEIGKTYTRTYITNSSTVIIDTVTVKAIKGDYIQFTNGEIEQFGSSLGFYQWKELK